MAASIAFIIFDGVFSAVLASFPAVNTKMVVFDTAVVDLSEKLADSIKRGSDRRFARLASQTKSGQQLKPSAADLRKKRTYPQRKGFSAEFPKRCRRCAVAKFETTMCLTVFGNRIYDRGSLFLDSDFGVNGQDLPPPVDTDELLIRSTGESSIPTSVSILGGP